MHDAIGFSAEYTGEVQRVGNVTEMDIVRLLYHEGDPRSGLMEIRHSKTPISRAMIARWDRWPETRVHDLARKVDGAIQFEFDSAHGK